MIQETKNIITRYKRRENIIPLKYNILLPYMYMIKQEQERAIIRLFNKIKFAPLENKKLLEIGCGSGSDILKFINLGFKPENITGNELLPNRAEIAKTRVPVGVKILESSALDLNFEEESFDIIYQSMVFSSILNFEYQQTLALKMWTFAKKGGGILWYDFIYDNPNNKDVVGMSYNKIKLLFPKAKILKFKITLAPPISRIVTKVNYKFYHIFNSFNFLRTHLLCWIQK